MVVIEEKKGWYFEENRFEYLKNIREIRFVSKSRDRQVFDLAGWNVLNVQK